MRARHASSAAERASAVGGDDVEARDVLILARASRIAVRSTMARDREALSSMLRAAV